MIALPEHIERNLLDANFTSTEVLVIRHLVGSNPASLRELASKTGKSTGVLDRAIKKLITKKIVEKSVLNGAPKFAIASLDAVLSWVQKDMQERWNQIKRKEQDLESFITSVEQESAQPKIEYFEGEEGVRKAYRKLLHAGDEILHSFPHLTLDQTQTDSLQSIEEECLKERRARGVFARVLAYDNPAGRKYQSRDHYAYRSTVLVPEHEYSIAFAKCIAGDIVGCFTYNQNKACLIHFPELARTEKHTFELLWGMMTKRMERKLTEYAEQGGIQELHRGFFAQLYEAILSKAPGFIRDLFSSYRSVVKAHRKYAEGKYIFLLEAFTQDRAQMIYDISGCFARRNINILKFRIYAAPPKCTLYDIEYEARSNEEASYLADALRAVPSVLQVRQRKRGE